MTVKISCFGCLFQRISIVHLSKKNLKKLCFSNRIVIPFIKKLPKITEKENCYGMENFFINIQNFKEINPKVIDIINKFEVI